MKGIVLNRSLPGNLELKELAPQSLQPNQVRIKVLAAALNHRDEWCRKGKYPNLKDGVILGSDACGTIIELGSEVTGLKLGQDVIVNPALHWGESNLAQSESFQIIGMPSDGTLAEELVINSDRVFSKPEHLSATEAAALPLAGLTAFRALMTQGGLTSGDCVLISGFGGGVAQFAAQFALAMGVDVYVTSSSAEKIERALDLGAKAGFDYRKEDWADAAKSETGGFDLIIDGAAGDGLNELVKATKPGGRIVIYGATQGNPGSLEARRIFWNQLKIIGTTMGSDSDFEAMLNYVQKHQIKPLVDSVYGFQEAAKAFDKMDQGLQLGKIVLAP
ncbi:zinc-binding dehydrogenase [Algoriphagus vanfongensis]|uniref:zinc-binding dehydrogenase n=1 Tax=Algoriphagus vanfongensis TaxID=426371 RepID=UPI00040A285B|nr:zinc-binding dehydrogenase [Algoriphagus vanfongensis]